MSELLAKVEELRNLDPSLHWFCGRVEPALEHASGGSLEAVSAQHCPDLVFETLMIFSYDGAQTEAPKQFLVSGMTCNLLRCESCIAAYYKGKKKMLDGLREDGYEDEQVEAFADIFDEQGVERISHGLRRAAATIRDLPERDRCPGMLNRSDLMAICEALYCEKFLKDETRMASIFDEPFQSCQAQERLSLTGITPAMTRFAFGEHIYRRDWALTEWRSRRSSPNMEDFDTAMRPGICDALSKVVSLPVTDINLIACFWTAMKSIIGALDCDVITHGLRNMEIDVCRLTIDHLNIDGVSFKPLVQTITIMLEKAPKDFWDAMGPISPQAIIEGIFNNPCYDWNVAASGHDGERATDKLHDLDAWVRPFMESIQSTNQPPTCRSLTFQFMQRLQAECFPAAARARCYNTGLNVLSWTLSLCLRHDTTSDAVSRAVVTDLLNIVKTHLNDLIARIEGASKHSVTAATVSLCQGVVQAALTLECRLLRIDHTTLATDKHLSSSSAHINLDIWKRVAGKTNTKNTALAEAALSASHELLGLGRFGPKGDASFAKEKGRFNEQFLECNGLMSKVLENVADISSERLRHFVGNEKARSALIAALVSSEKTLCEAATNVIKNMSGEVMRQDAIKHMLELSFAGVINDFANTLAHLADSKSFYSCPRMLRSSADIVNILCDSQDGMLRCRQLSVNESSSVKHFWRCQWRCLTTIYGMTERWSSEQDRAMLKEFCRDTMQFSATLFEEYVVFADATLDADILTEKTAQSELLIDPSCTMESMVNWLRLRDEYLAATAVRIIKKLLGQLYASKLQVPEKVSSFLDHVVQNTTRTILSEQQKAELARALEGDLEQEPSFSASVGQPGKPSRKTVTVHVNSDSANDKVKSSKIDMKIWAARARIGGSQLKKVVDLTDDSSTLDDNIRAQSESVEDYKQLQAQAASKVQSAVQRTDTRRQAEQAAFMEKRQKERLEKKQRDFAVAAKLKAQNANNLTGQTTGAGSALNALGNIGRDHSKKGTGMMVSSEESNSDDDLDTALFGTSKTHRVSSIYRDLEAARRQSEHNRGPVKKTRQVRSAKDMRARLIPDLTPLHRRVLAWDLFQSGDSPPGSTKTDYTLVSESFRTPNEYQRTFEPLLLLEAWQGFQQIREEGWSQAIAVKVANRLSVDMLVEVSTSIDMSTFKELGLSESDILILSKDKSPNSSNMRCLARVHKVGRKKPTSAELILRVTPTNNSLLPALSPNADIFGIKIGSLTSLEREYSALLGLQYYDLCDEIIKAVPSPLLRYPEERIGKISRLYNLNDAQAKAVQSAVDNDAFTLIQGPPGSGKTKTIISIVGALLTETMRHSGSIATTQPKCKHATKPVPRSGVAAKKLLICAPSNAAVDELVMRLMDGVKTYLGETHQLSVIRLGRSDRINPKVAAVTLDELVKEKLKLADRAEKQPDEMGKHMAEHKATCTEINRIRAIFDEMDEKGIQVNQQHRATLESLKQKRQALSNRIDQLKDSGNTLARDADIRRRHAQQEIIDSAHVLCATLSGSGHDMFQQLKIDFETVIIDEAAQSVELSALIPLKYGCQKCIMVGDPKQLPPTVLSREAARFQYEQSLFVRMQINRPNDVHLLDTQYRMHPEISKFPSKTFYEGRLLDGELMAEQRTKLWHQDEFLGPYRFFDVQGQHRSGPRGHSLVNTAEVEVAYHLYLRLRAAAKDYDFTGKIGVITPYKSQLQKLRDRFHRDFGEDIFKMIEFNTTDAFQGRESEVIIFSCVRASDRGIGFLADIRRMNVGITRAKCSLWVLGHVASLQQGEFWNMLIKDARERDRLTSGDVRQLLQRPTLPIARWHNTTSASTVPYQLASTSTAIITHKSDFRQVEDSSHMDVDLARSEPANKARKQDSRPSESNGKGNGQAEKRRRSLSGSGHSPQVASKAPKVHSDSIAARDAVSKKQSLSQLSTLGGSEVMLGDDWPVGNTKPVPTRPATKPPAQVKRKPPNVFITPSRKR